MWNVFSQNLAHGMAINMSPSISKKLKGNPTMKKTKKKQVNKIFLCEEHFKRQT